MNIVVMRLALRSLLGSRRSWILVGLAVLLFGVAGLTRWGSGGDIHSSASLVMNFGLGTLVPVMCLLIGTGVIAPEIEDGSIVYLLAKPLSRRAIALSKLSVATLVAVVSTVASIAIACLIAGDEHGRLALAMSGATALAAVAYTAVFFAIAILTRNPIIIGLIYALLWEGVLAGYVPGVRAVSIRQWALAPAEQLLTDPGALGVKSEVGVAVGLLMLALATAGAIVAATWRLARLPVRVSD
ncbi:ABC transporter permease [Demequina capsici]|uniref:ABC transporter permease n=1 Tax=Demequina capsici TaxID=3075620 RepID=A0AA96F9I7_9MICO|nr:ABC transporter permease [Demequina sp. OYTSA14]WNM25277.1 ABC transporter permease [Demequina sp. OYTSA14]